AFLVGSAVAQSGRHAADEIWIGAPLIQREETAKAAHARPGCRSGDVSRSGGAACGYDRTIPRRWIANCTGGAGGFGGRAGPSGGGDAKRVGRLRPVHGAGDQPRITNDLPRAFTRSRVRTRQTRLSFISLHVASLARTGWRVRSR